MRRLLRLARVGRASLMLLAVLASAHVTTAAVAWPAAMAGSDSVGQSATSAAGQQELKAAIIARFQAYAIRGGVLLIPRDPTHAADSIELRDGTIAIGGRLVTPAELEQRLGPDTKPVVALSRLDVAARQALLFGTPSSRREGPEIIQAVPGPSEGAAGAGTDTRGEKRDRARQSRSRVRVGGTIRVEPDEIVAGSVVAVLGSAVIRGQVQEDVVVVAGNVDVGAGADVQGDITVVGGALRVDPAARVGGEIHEVGFGGLWEREDATRRWWPELRLPRWQWHTPVVGLFFLLLRFALIGLVALLAALAVTTPVRRVAHQVAADPWRSGLAGLLAELLLVPALVLLVAVLVVSIVGIPLLALVPFAVLVIVAALVMGFVGVGLHVGQWVARRFGWPNPSIFAALVIGLGAIWVPTLTGHVLRLGGWPVWGLAAALLVIGFLVEYAAWTVGFGAVILTRFGTRPRQITSTSGSEVSQASELPGSGPQAVTGQ